MANKDSQLSMYQDHFRHYPDAPESAFKPIERRVQGQYGEHAIGATAVSLVEQHGILADTRFELDNHRNIAQTLVDSVPTSDSLKYIAKYKEKPLPKLRKFIDKLDYLDSVRKNDIDRNQRELTEELKKIREKIDNAPEEIIDLLTLSIEQGASPYISAQYWYSVDLAEEVGDHRPDPVDWLIEDSEEGEQRLINFLKFSVNAYENLQDEPSRNELVVEEKSEWLSGVIKAEHNGWLIIDKERIKSEIEDLVVRFGDHFDLRAQDRGGYAYRGMRYIVLGKSHKDIKHAAKHELNHALLGQFEDTWLDEATTEHVAQTLDGRREVEEVADDKSEPENRFYDSAYRSERDLLATLINMTNGQVKMSDVTKAYSKSRTDNILEDSYIELEVMLDLALGVEFSLSRIQAHISSLQRKLIDDEGLRTYAALHEACRIARSDLLQQPEVIFNNLEQKVA